MHRHISKFVAIFGDSEHHRLGQLAAQFLSQDTSFFCLLVPILWVSEMWGNGHGQMIPEASAGSEVELGRDAAPFPLRRGSSQDAVRSM